MSYLAKRGLVYYFRRIVLDDLKPVLGKSEMMKSLRTKNREQAKRLVPTEVITSSTAKMAFRGTSKFRVLDFVCAPMQAGKGAIKGTRLCD